MKFIQVFSSVYLSSTVLTSFIYPGLFVPLTVSYVLGVGEYELLNFVERKWGK
jgi:hypothetical protein